MCVLGQGEKREAIPLPFILFFWQGLVGVGEVLNKLFIWE